jgi:hypothetical protein
MRVKLIIGCGSNEDGDCGGQKVLMASFLPQPHYFSGLMQPEVEMFISRSCSLFCRKALSQKLYFDFPKKNPFRTGTFFGRLDNMPSF